MQRLILQKPVTLSGPNFFGHPGRIELSPARSAGWYWRFNGDKCTVPIGMACIRPENGLQNIALHHGRFWLMIYEHIGTLAFGLDQVIVSSTALPPYHGRAGDLWEAVKSHGGCSTSHHAVWVTGQQPIKMSHQKVKDGYLHFYPSDSPCLKVTIHITYPGLGEYKLEWSTDTDTIDEAVSAFAQGWPPDRIELAKLLHWPHRHRVTWPQDYDDPQVALRLFALHRLADLLGCLSLVSHQHLLAGEVISYGAGHAEDLALVKQIARSLHFVKT